MVWQATLTQFVAEHPTARLNYRLLDEPHARWNVVALFGAQSAPEALAFDRSIAALRHDGNAARILVRPRERHAEVPFIQPAAYQMKSQSLMPPGPWWRRTGSAEGAALPAL